MKRLIVGLTLVAAMAPAAGRAATTHTVFMNAFRFCNTPACLANEDTRIAKGDTVQWVFADPACAALVPLGCAHTATRSASPAFNSGTMPLRGSAANPVFSFTFNTTGTFAYFCAIHPTTPGGGPMQARIIVS